MTAPTIDERRALANLMSLLAIPGLSGEETDVARAVRRIAREAGCKASWIAFDEAHLRIGDDFACGNLIVRLPGTHDGPRRLFSGHLDTVPLCRGAEPVRRGRRIVARGPTALGGDNRTAVACLVTVLETLLRRGLSHPPLTFLFTVGEEVGLRGARHLRVTDLGRPRLGFNVDGGDPADLWTGALGADRWDVEVLGRASHAGVHPERGISAALIAAQAVSAAARAGWFGVIRRGRRRGTANVGVLRGGEATNQVTDHVLVRGESRSHDPDFVTTITDAWEGAFRRAASAVRDHRGRTGRVRFRRRADYAPFRLAADAPVVRLALEAAEAIGLRPRTGHADGGLDANHLNAKGIPTVTLGAGQHAPHTVDEYVVVSEYLDGCRLALRLATA